MQHIKLELCSVCRADTPSMLHYETLLGSLYNTPPCWSIYICGLVFEHLLAQARTIFRSLMRCKQCIPLPLLGILLDLSATVVCQRQ